MRLAETLLRALPPLRDIEREAFRSQLSDAGCDALGRQTRSAAVLDDAMAFASVIGRTLQARPEAVRRYSPSRLAWLLECIVALDDARASDAAGRDAARPIATAVERAEERALHVRTDLLHALELLASDDEPDLDEARGSTDDLVASLGALAKLADRWLRKTDAQSKALVASIALTHGDVDAAWAAAEALQSALDRAAGRATIGERDTAPVNRAEGRVLHEMRYAMRAFGHAHEADRTVPALVPGPATRHALGLRTRGRAPGRS